MKKQKFELSHDIIAEKVWARLPEQDKQLRMIQASIRLRQQDYSEGKGSLLGKAELEGWSLFLPKLELSEEEVEFIEESETKLKALQDAKRKLEEAEKKALEEKQLKLSLRNHQLKKLALTGVMLAVLVFVVLIWRSNYLSDKFNDVAASYANFVESERALEEGKVEKAFRLLQQEEWESPDDTVTDLKLQEYVNYLGFFHQDGVISYQVSSSKEYVACLQEKNDTIFCYAYDLGNKSFSQPIFKSLPMAKFDNGDYSYRFGDKGDLACVIIDKGKVKCQFVSLEDSLLKSRIFPLATSYQDNEDISYHDSYKFIDGGYLALLLLNSNDSITYMLHHIKGTQETPKGKLPLAKDDAKGYICSFSARGHLALVTLPPKQRDAKLQIRNLKTNSIQSENPLTVLAKSINLKPAVANSLSHYKNSYRFSHEGKYLACLVKRSYKALPSCRVFRLADSLPMERLWTSKVLEGSYISKPYFVKKTSPQGAQSKRYTESYRFSNDDKHLVCLIKDGNKIVCQLLSFQDSSVQDFILETPSLNWNDSHAYFFNDTLVSHYSYANSYHFSEKGGHFACLIEEDDSVISQVFAFDDSLYSKRQMSSSALAPSGSEENHSNFSNSYTLSDNGEYFAYLLQKDSTIQCQLYDLDSSSSIQFSPLVASNVDHNIDTDSDHESTHKNFNFRFSEGEGYLLYLENKDEKTILASYSMNNKTRRFFEGVSSIESFESISPQQVIYMTEDSSLKVVNISIPQGSLISYYDNILPSLDELEELE